jgi:hypothetical protein
MKRTAIALFGLLLVSTLTSCGTTTAAAGPIDGSYSLTSFKCDGVESLGGAVIVYTVANSTASAAETKGGGCIQTDTFAASYPSSTTYSSTRTAKACSAECTAGQCSATTVTGEAAQVETYALSGSTLTFTRVETATDADCASGQTVVAVLTKI